MPNELMSQIHDRMPVILDREDESMWLNRDVTDSVLVASVLRAYPAEDMRAYPVSSAVGNWRNDEPALIEEI